MLIKDLKLPKKDLDKLLKLGVLDALGILMMRKASPDAFDEYIGRNRSEQIQEILKAALNDEERKLLAAPLPPTRPLGARLRHKLQSKTKLDPGQNRK